MPVGRKASPGYRPPSEIDSDERVRLLEVRLNVAEKSNRALLEEVLRLQGEVKATNRRNEDLVREERSSRHTLESAMKINNDLITQLSSRIKEAEDKLTDEKTALSSLVNHTKGVEQAVRSSQNELIAKKDVQSGRWVLCPAIFFKSKGTFILIRLFTRMSIFIPTTTKLGGGGILTSPCLFVCLSVDAR